MAETVAEGASRADRSRITVLDSLRGMVALLVVVHHVWVLFSVQVAAHIPYAALALWEGVQAQNHRAVMAFFVLSGYTIALATRGRLPLGRAGARDYLVRRGRRIVPLFYASLAWTAVLGLATGPGGAEYGLTTLAGNMVFLQTSLASKGMWFAPFGGNGPYWSLSYEMAYYLALPLVLPMVAQGGKGLRSSGEANNAERLRLIGLGLVAMISGLALNKLAPNPFASFATLWIVWVAGFAVQGLVAQPRSLLVLALPAAGSWGLAGVLALAGRWSDTLVGALEGTALALIFGVLATWRGWTRWAGVGALGGVFNLLFARIGRGSYALYLLHYPMLKALHAVLLAGMENWAGWLAGGGVFLAFVVVFCPWVERLSLDLFCPRALPGTGA